MSLDLNFHAAALEAAAYFKAHPLSRVMRHGARRAREKTENTAQRRLLGDIAVHYYGRVDNDDALRSDANLALTWYFFQHVKRLHRPGKLSVGVPVYRIGGSTASPQAVARDRYKHSLILLMDKMAPENPKEVLVFLQSLLREHLPQALDSSAQGIGFMSDLALLVLKHGFTLAKQDAKAMRAVTYDLAQYLSFSNATWDEGSAVADLHQALKAPEFLRPAEPHARGKKRRANPAAPKR